MLDEKRWQDKSLWDVPFCYALCTTEEMFHEELERMQVKDKCPFTANSHSDATVHWYETEDRAISALVCVRPLKNLDPIQVACIIVHEAVHLWQEARDRYSEKMPGKESEAYAIQRLSQNLMFEYRRQVYGTDS